ncbi:MAG: sulfotransferase [Luteolibacter sp.]|uniref:sulfotransferase family protein n=1 Tax=Luteolibacter sp. TaxID=1962973 RepID=UPI0032678C67
MKFFDIFRPKKQEPRVARTARQLPDFLVIGVQKGGTSWLWDQLRQHPKIWMPPFKELQFFNHEFIPSHRNFTTNHCDKAIKRLIEKKKTLNNPARKLAWDTYLEKISRNPKPSLEWYKDCFSFPIKPWMIRGDISPAYCTIPEEGVTYVKELLPDAKIIMIVRNPLKRVISHLRMKISVTGRNVESFTTAQWHGFIDDENLYQRGIYSQYIPRWERHFGNQITFLPFDMIRNDPAAFLGKVTHHLAIKPFTPKAAEKPIHVTEKHPIPEPIVKLLEERTAAEWAYLQSRFPADFLELCQH